MIKLLWVTISYLLIGCVNIPEGIEPVSSFSLERYLGTWYEIARLDHSFEKDLRDVTATYSRRDDGGIRVVNRGFDPSKNKWKEAIGKAYFIEDSHQGLLKVSFFGPFYGAYVIFELDPNYQYAFVSGPGRDYLWLLARTPKVSAELIEHFRQKAKALGFDLSRLQLVEHATPSEQTTN